MNYPFLTQKERDIETGLDYFIHRYHSSVQGRFVSPDLPFADQSEEDPQSWNLYIYVRNSPLNLTDPFGLWHWVDPEKNGNRFIQWDPGDDWYSLSNFLYKETGRDYLPNDLEKVYGSGGLGADTIVDLTGAPSHYFTDNRGGVQDTSWDFYLTVLPAAQGAKAAGGLLRGAWRGLAGLLTRKAVTTAVKEEGLIAIRQAYEVEVKALAEKAAEMKAAGHSVEEIAIKVHAERRALGIKYKDMTPPEMLKTILERNLKKYGDELGPTIEWLRAQGKSWEEIIESASRSGGGDLKP